MRYRIPNMPTPAEQLAKTKRRRKPRRLGQGKVANRKHWVCKMADLRESLGLSIRDVAEACGFSVAGLWQIEHGTDPMLRSAATLAAFYGKQIHELWPERLPEKD